MLPCSRRTRKSVEESRNDKIIEKNSKSTKPSLTIDNGSLLEAPTSYLESTMNDFIPKNENGEDIKNVDEHKVEYSQKRDKDLKTLYDNTRIDLLTQK